MQSSFIMSEYIAFMGKPLFFIVAHIATTGSNAKARARASKRRTWRYIKREYTILHSIPFQ